MTAAFAWYVETCKQLREAAQMGDDPLTAAELARVDTSIAVLDGEQPPQPERDLWQLDLSWPWTYRNLRDAPSTAARVTGRINNGDVIEVDAYATDSAGREWAQLVDGRGWTYLGSMKRV